MSRLPDELIEMAKESVAIRDVVDEHTKIGRDNRGRCPICKSRNKTSFSIEPRSNSWHCWSCHAGGGQIQFLMAIGDVRFREAAEILLSMAGLRTDAAIPPHFTERLAEQRKAREKEKAQAEADALTHLEIMRKLHRLKARKKALSGYARNRGEFTEEDASEYAEICDEIVLLEARHCELVGA